MTSYTVYGNATPVVTNGNDGDDYALGTVVLVASATGFITHARWYFSNPLPSGPVTWRVSDLETLDLIVSHVFTSPASGWVQQALVTPIEIVGPRNLLVWVGTPDGYVYTNGLFSSTGITNGPLTAPATASDPEGVGNGRFGGDDESPPMGTSGATSYFADLVFEIPAPQGEAAFSLNLAVAAAGERASEGIAAFGLGLAVAASGDAPAIPPSEGVADFGMLFSVFGTGETPPVGTASGSAAFSLNFSLAAAGDAPAIPPAQGVAGFGLGLALAATGDAPSIGAAGQADFGMRFSATGTGFTPDPGQASGVAAFTLNLSPAAAGGRAAGGVAALTLNLALAAAGGEAPPFPCRPVRSFAEVMQS